MQRVRVAYDVVNDFPSYLDRAGEAMNRLWARLRSHRGMTLIELMVAMTLLGVVSSLVVVGVQQAGRILTHTDDENRGLQDAKVILDRLSRDIRQARGVVCDGAGGDTYCKQHLQLWIDDDSDYVKDPEEVVTWTLEDNPDGEHFDVWRIQGVAPATPVEAAPGLCPDREDALLLRRGGQHQIRARHAWSASRWSTTRSSAAARTSRRPQSPCGSGTRSERHAERNPQPACGDDSGHRHDPRASASPCSSPV